MWHMRMAWSFFLLRHLACELYWAHAINLLMSMPSCIIWYRTAFMAMRPKTFKNMLLPGFTLCNRTLGFVGVYKYLDFLISDNLRYNSEIQQQHRLLWCRTNSLIRKSSMCSYSVKKIIFYQLLCYRVPTIFIFGVCMAPQCWNSSSFALIMQSGYFLGVIIHVVVSLQCMYVRT